MGTLVSITLYAATEERAQAAFLAAFARVAAVDRQFTDYTDTSELAQLCTSSARMSDSMKAVLTYAQELAERTSGAFDITVGPLTKLWRKRQWPDQSMVNAARTQVGYRKLHLEGANRCDSPEMHLDAGGIAKGFAADQALQALRSLGIGRALIAVSGDIRIGAAPPEATGWRVDINGRTEVLQDCAVSTSGDEFQFQEHNGVRYSHIIDPRTGWPLNGVRTVSVIAPTGMEADALATAANVLGPEASASNSLLRNARLIWH